MKGTMTHPSGWVLFAILAAVASWFLAVPIAAAQGQNLQGQDAVYPASGTCCAPSPSFIDASMFAGNPSQHNICAVLNFILTPSNGFMPSAGAVIDARGLASSIPATSMTCTAANPSPWAGISNPPPSTILLPAGTIVIPSGWILPNNTRLIGEGDGIPSSGLTPGTTIQAASGFSGTMIQFGSTAPICPENSGLPVCTGIALERLTLDGQGQLGQSVSGIGNAESQANSYVDHVSLYRILGTGLSVTGTANDSGPYSNITFDLGGVSGTSSTVCAKINGPSGTRGIHGLSCTAENSNPQAAVLLDSSNNSLEDVRIVGFYDGIRVGANNTAQSDVLINIIGDTNPVIGGTTPIIVVHIESVGNTVSDLSIMGANNTGSTGTITIKDDLTSTSLVDTSVGIYALGEKAADGGYSRFTTSPNAPHWTVGTAAPTTTSTPCSQGSLYSCTNVYGGGTTGCDVGTTPYALWVCGPSGSSTAWIPIQ